ncbi:MAG: hypothetical protein ACKVZJ_08340 [Phycisphaerales bacterium]
MIQPNVPTRAPCPTAEAGAAFAPPERARGVPRRRSFSQLVIAIVAVILALSVLAVWVLIRLPRAELARVPGTGLAISNRGLPVSNARITANLADGTTMVIDAGGGHLPRGETTVPLPASVSAASIQSVVIEGEVLGMMTVNSISIVAPLPTASASPAGTNTPPARPPSAVSSAGPP